MKNELEKLIEEKKANDRRQRTISVIIILISIGLISIIFYSITLKQKVNIALSQKLDTAQIVVRQKDSITKELTTQLDNVRLANEQLNIGVNFATTKRSTQAISAYTQAIELDSNNAVAYNLRGYIFFIRDEYEKAVNDLKYSVKLDSTYTWGHYNLALAYMAIKDTIHALAEVKKVIQIDSSFRKIIKNDIHFNKFEKLPDFQAIIRK